MKTKTIFLILSFLLFVGMNVQAQESEYCEYSFNPVSGGNAVAGDEDVALFTWETRGNGNIVITIAPQNDNYPNTSFRGNGINNVSAITVNGTDNSNNRFFILQINDAKTEITLIPQQPIADGVIISYTGILEYRTTTVAVNGMELQNLYPAAPFTGYTYGTNCSGTVFEKLNKPTNVSISNKVLTFTPVANADSYLVTVLRGENVFYTQTVNGSGETLNLFFPGNFTVKVTASDFEGIYANSEPSDAVEWNLVIPDTEITDPSAYCNYLVNIQSGGNAVATDADACYFTLETANTTEGDIQAGDIVVTITPYNGQTAEFRDGGMRINNFTVAGINGALVLQKISGNTANPHIFRPLQGVTIPKGSIISYNGMIEWRVGTYNLYPDVSFPNFIYGSDCSSVPLLNTPVDLSINADNELSFTSDVNAGSYTVTVYNNGQLIYSQPNFQSGNKINLALSGNFTVKVQAVSSNTLSYLDSELSEAVNWNVQYPDKVVGNSEYCDYFFNPDAENGNGVSSDEDAVFFTWETLSNGDIVVTIAGQGNHTETTAFRNNGLNLNNFTIDGISATRILQKIGENTGITQTFRPQEGITIPKGAIIRYSGYVEYRTLPLSSAGELDNLYPTITSEYTYGSNCATDPSIPASIKINPQEAVLLASIPEELNILSLNNSLIDYNDQPAIFELLAQASQKTATWTKQTRLGESLRQHYEAADGSSKAAVASQAWTHILLQEQSNKPLTDPADFMASVKLWVEYIRKNCPNPNVKIILTLNWPYTDATDFNSDMQNLYSAYKSISQETGISICPVGNAYKLILDTDGEMSKNALYSDNRHPTLLASYLAASTVYATLFGETPEENTYFPEGITLEDAKRMQTRAWQACSAHQPQEVVDDYAHTVRYTYTVYDQYNKPIDAEGLSITWNAEGGSIDENGVFVSNGTEGNYEISIQLDAEEKIEAIANLHVAAYSVVEPPLDYIEIQDNEIYAQNFDAIGTEAIATLPVGWKIDKNTTTPRVVGKYNIAGTQTEQRGGNEMASNAKNGIYNFGAGDAATALDRAIGGNTTGSGTTDGADCVNIYLKLKNTGISDINGLDIAYDVEKYRKGANAKGFRIQMYYSTDGTNWSSAGTNFYTFFAADATTEGYASTPGENRSVKAILPQTITAGEELYLAWNYSVESGTEGNAAQSLGLDNVVIQAGIIAKWEGTSSSTEWNDPANWSIGVVPGNVDHIVIPVSDNYPEIPNNTTVRSITFENGAGANIGNSGSITVTDAAKVEYTVEEGRWYSIGFPFEIERVYSEKLKKDLTPYDKEEGGHFWLKKYKGDDNLFEFTKTIEANTGYIVQFPEFFDKTKVTFISTPNQSLTNTNELEFSSAYELQANPRIAPYVLPTTGNRYYKYDPKDNKYKLQEEAGTVTVLPFESVVTFSNPENASMRQTIGDGSQAGTITNIELSRLSDDPVIDMRYYTLYGTEIQKPLENGVYIMKKIHASQKEETVKIVYIKK